MPAQGNAGLLPCSRQKESCHRESALRAVREAPRRKRDAPGTRVEPGGPLTPSGGQSTEEDRAADPPTCRRRRRSRAVASRRGRGTSEVGYGGVIARELGAAVALPVLADLKRRKPRRRVACLPRSMCPESATARAKLHAVFRTDAR